MIHILFMILKALGILLLVLLFLVLLIVCTVLFLPFCYRAQVLKEEEGFACVKASGRVSWLFGAVALTASYEEQKPEAQILLFGASLETWKRRLKKIRRGEASVSRTEENETEKSHFAGCNKKNTSLFMGLVFFICAKCGRERGILRIEVI